MSKLVKGLLLGLGICGASLSLASCKADEGIDLDETNKPKPQVPSDEDLDNMEEEKNYTATELWTEAVKKYEAETNISRDSYVEWDVSDGTYWGKPVNVEFNIMYKDYINGNRYFHEEIVLGSFDMMFGGMAPAHEYKKFYFDGTSRNDEGLARVYSVYEYKSQNDVKKDQYLPGASKEDPWTVSIDTNYEEKWIGDQCDGLTFDEAFELYKALPGYDLSTEANFVQVPEVKKDEEKKMYYFQVTINKDTILLNHEAVGERFDPKCKLETLEFTQDTPITVGINYDLELKSISYNEACTGKFLTQEVQANTSVKSTLEFTYGDDAAITDEIIDADLLPSAQAKVVALTRKNEE